MKLMLTAVVTLMLFAGAVCAGQFNAVEKAGDVTVKVTLENSPLTVADNTASIEILDASGRAITDADVSVYFFMPSMPAMNYEVQAAHSGTGYRAVIKPTMPGEWKADIRVKQSGGEASTATVSFEAK